MTPEQLAFLQSNVMPLEQAILEHPIGELFSGEIYLDDDVPLVEMQLPGFPVLTPEQVARIFIVPDDSILAIKRTPERDDGAPEGIEVISDNGYLQEDSPARVIAYDDAYGGVIRVNSLHLRSLMLEDDAPERFATIAIGLMACTAYKLGFKKISLFAAGSGPLDQAGDFIGYAIWPRMGFDAPLLPVDIQKGLHLLDCETVGQVVSRDQQWWDDNGTGRDMEFDLAAGSHSWNVLINYIYPVLV